MLELLDIHKDYFLDKKPVPALKGITLTFGENGFVSVLGPSGCGKTTLLNIIGGLDRYTSGDLLIDNKSTKSFNDSDWDSYRNVRVGFVFQSYNLISHQSVLSNVETPLILNGIKKADRKKMALEALKSVGLENEFKKKPNQMSGGQMQRVALARAIVNNPKIILADEPTGALDSATSIQVMDILKEISKEKLVIMVTHNRELAERYSDRIIEMKDGEVVNDSAPIENDAAEVTEKEKNKKTSMSFATAFKSSLSNIRTKKTRTILTAVASSIGLIGVALVLSVTNGFTNYMNNVEKLVASAIPISIVPTTYSYGSLNQNTETELYPEDKYVKVDDNSQSIVSIHQNKFTEEYRQYLNALVTDPTKSKWVDSILYNRLNQDFHLLTDCGNYIIQPNAYKSAGSMSGTISSVTGLPAYSFHELYVEGDKLTDWYDCIAGKYPTAKDEIVLIIDRENKISKSTLSNLGFLDPDQTIADKEISFDDILNKTYKVYRQVDWYRNDEYKSYTKKVWEVDKFNVDTFQLEAHESTQEVHYFQRTHNFAGVYNNDDLYNPLKLKVVGILRPTKNSYISLMPSSLAYTSALKDYITADGTGDTDETAREANIELDKKIKTAASTNVYLPKPDIYNNLDGLAELNSYFTEINKINKGETHSMQEILKLIQDGKSSELDETDTAKIATAYSNFISVLDSALGFTAFEASKDQTIPSNVTRSTFLTNAQKVGADLKQEDAALNMSASSVLALILKWGGIDGLLTNGVQAFFNGFADLNRENICAIDYVALMRQFSLVTSILIFPSSLTVKEKLVSYLDAYNYENYDTNDSKRPEEEQILYTDVMSTFTETIGVLINVISIVLIVFASISLVVSSIMTGIITYVSVVERTKEIGILRACGARKKDVGRLFEAECVVIGALAGLIGIIVTAILDVPLSLIIDHVYPGNNLQNIATLNPWHAIVLIAISILLAFISGLIPARVASNKDPVIALRSE